MPQAVPSAPTRVTVPGLAVGLPAAVAGPPDLWYAAAVTGPTSHDLDATSTVLDWFDHH